MAGIEAEPDRHVCKLGGEFAHHVQFFEAPAELRARPHCILDQQRQVPQLQPLRGRRYAFQEMHDPLLDGVALVIPRMRDQILRADRYGTHQLTAKRLDRELACFLVRRSQIDQVVVVNHQRIQVVLLAGLVQ